MTKVDATIWGFRGGWFRESVGFNKIIQVNYRICLFKSHAAEVAV
jgi:hypothetical protein